MHTGPLHLHSHQWRFRSLCLSPLTCSTTNQTNFSVFEGLVWLDQVHGNKLGLSWAPKNWRFWTVVLEKTLESPLDCKEIQPVHPKADQSWMSIGRTDAAAEAPILWPPHAKNWLIWKDPDTGKDWRCEEKGTTDDEMVGWYHRLNGHEFEETLGVGDGQGGLECCSPRGCKESDTTEQLNWTELGYLKINEFVTLNPSGNPFPM